MAVGTARLQSITTPALPRSRETSPVLAETLTGMADALFSLKTYAAAILAYYIALRIGLHRPYWSVITCYIVAQPLAGAMLSKAVFRMIGTVFGALVAIILVPQFVNSPELLTWVLGLWLALCTYVAMLDRTPRSYVFLLAGYTASIIGFAAVSHPSTIFDIASLRVQEIIIGIWSSAVVNALIFPRTVSAKLAERASQILTDAERWSRDALSAQDNAEDAATLDRDRRRLALDLHELHQLAVQLPFDLSRFTVRVAVLRVLQDRLSMLLPLASGIEDRIGQLHAAEAMPPDIAALIADITLWLNDLSSAAETIPQADALIARAHALEPRDESEWDWETGLCLSLLDRLQDLIRIHRDARELHAIILSPTTAPSPNIAAAIRNARAMPLHRDHGLALRSALATMATLGIGTAMWIATAWPDGSTAVVIACIICALFSHLDNPGPTASRLLYGTLAAMPIGAFYAFVLMPRLSDFPAMVGVLAPVMLIVGSLQARPSTAIFAIGIMLTLPGLVGLNEEYDANFQTFTNFAIAQIVGVGIAVFVLNFASSVGTRSSAIRLVRSGWRELAGMAGGRDSLDLNAWIGRMIDRVAMLTPRLKYLAIDPTQPLLDILADTRIGMAIHDLRTFQERASPWSARQVAVVLKHVEQHFTQLRDDRPIDPDPALVRAIDLVLAKVAALEDLEQRRLGVLALTSLRRNLASYAPPPPAMRRQREDGSAVLPG
ncbi:MULTISPECIES: FUSC family protein [Sphingomonadaceae]|uniref:FUSC family protein n=1 Tax=Sphingomonadaceae TaxID=41297 RepID=UPI001F5D5F30|nr:MULTISPECIES: FUSC family protein [Sphingomonadaceae]